LPSSNRHSTDEHRGETGAIAELIAPAAVLLSTGFLLISSGGRDDAHITLGQLTLARTGRILNYNGGHLEQSSSLLHVLVLAALSWMPRARQAVIDCRRR
jgi:hypothetical protein